MQRPVQITRIAKDDFHRMILDLTAERKTRTLEPQLDLLKLSRLVADRLSVDAAKPVPECVPCGVCCNMAMIAQVTPHEEQRLTEVVELTLDDSEHEIVVDAVLPRDMATGSCKFLAGELGHEVGCTIYETRPNVCRAFDPGSPRCHEYRRMYGLEPRLSEQEEETAANEVEAQWRPEKIDEVYTVEVGRKQRMEMTADGMVSSDSVILDLVGFVPGDETAHKLHTYYWPDETWYEGEFLGKTLEEASALISERAR